VSTQRFNRALAVYQVLPGPEATELCVYFGYLSRGRLGAVLAGLGFILPGVILMLLLSWLYATVGIVALFAGAFKGFQAAVGALLIRAVHTIGRGVLKDRIKWVLAIGAFLAQLLGVPFWVTGVVAGALHAVARRGTRLPASIIGVLLLVALGVWATRGLFTGDPTGPLVAGVGAPAGGALGTAGDAARSPASGALTTPNVPLPVLLLSGLRAGLLTFGGAYTAIPFIRRDAVVDNPWTAPWLTDPQFLDGLALSGILPAPLIIFGTFVGYVGGGLLGGLAMTLGIFLPAFLFTLVGHDFFERIVEDARVRSFLDGVTAGVVGIIAATVVVLLVGLVDGPVTAVLLVAALVTLYRWHAKAAIAVVVLAAGLLGALLFR
ncbi:MAG TPA: chromate transporter, partial [Chloroflexota bacterium]|nr:chromate transporter [Chloroflexota bacterium]